MLSAVFIRNYFFSARGGSLIKTIGRVSFVGIFLGVFALILVLSVMAGFNNTLKTRLLNVEPHVVVTDASAATVETVLGNQIAAEVFAFEVQDAIVRNDEGYTGGAVFKGVPLERLKQILKYENPDVPISHFIPEAGEVIVGTDLAASLRILEDSSLVVIPPETLIMPAGTQGNLAKVKVRNLFETGVNDIDGKMVFYILGQALRNFSESPSRQVGAEIILKDPFQAQTVLAILKAAGLKAETWADRNSAILKSLRIERMMVGTFVGLSALIAGFSIVGVMSLLLTQKKQDLGILMSLGVSRTKIARMYTMIGFGLSALAVISATASATAIAWLLNRYPIEVLPPIYQDRTIPAELNPTFIATVLFAALLLALLASAFSVHLHLRGRTPVQLLRRN